MSRFSTSLLLNTGLLLVTSLAAMPTKLLATTDLRQHPDLPSQTFVVQQPVPSSTKPTTSPAGNLDSAQPTLRERQPVTQPVPANGTSTATPSQPVTGTSPTPAVAPTTKPATANTQTPVNNAVTLLLKLKEKRVYVYKGEKLVNKYPVAIGKKGRETPTGEWQVMEKIKNPGWTSFRTGEYFAPGRENPLGARWIGFWTDGKDTIGFHGTTNLKSIGKAASNGCVRMSNRHVKALFPLVKVGTTVKVVDE
ncbi:L,D-transpeptidase family protein [Chamaesiphon sp. VAR_48_metabat_403]|uniref:L,D-transpeptidase n=1 Tax=Chamaesiphon sp. VAR_48_metabat_403 TaxID=2964700 RepID=UPI00286EA0AF|nr:L,D-transpeptidase family protein [Chamaesiphon sp. VAR_48_metabat_403]